MLGCLALVIVPFLWTPAKLVFAVLRGEEFEVASAVAAGVMVLFLGIAVLSLFVPRLSRVPFRVDFDRTAGEARLVHRRLVGGGERERVIRLDRLRAVTVRTITAVSRLQALSDAEAAKGKGLQILLRLARNEAGDRLETRDLTLRVLELDQSAEVVDFAYRIGAASGLTFAKVVRNDPKVVEVELLPTREPGFTPHPGTSPRPTMRATRSPPRHETRWPTRRSSLRAPDLSFGPSGPRLRASRSRGPPQALALRGPGLPAFHPARARGTVGLLHRSFHHPHRLPMRLFVSAFVGLFGLILGRSPWPSCIPPCPAP